VDQDIQAGLKIAAQNLQAGKAAMVERNHRRLGLGISLIAVGIVLAGLLAVHQEDRELDPQMHLFCQRFV